MKKKCLSSIVLITLLAFTASSQTLFNWAEQFSKTSLGYDFGLGITTDVPGNIYTIGRFSGLTDFDPSATNFFLTATSDDIFIAKTDPSGNFIWAKQIGGPYIDQGTSIVTDNSQNVYITGYFTDSVDFDPGPGIYKLYAPFMGAFICKLYSDGSFVWAYRVGSTATGMCGGICIDDQQDLYITGSFFGTTAPADFDPGPGTCYLTSSPEEHAYVCKFDTAGNFIWGKRTGGAGVSIALDQSKNIYVTGNFRGTADFDPGLGIFYITSVGDDNGGDGYVCKLDSIGNFLWAAAFTGWDNYSSAVCKSISSAPNGDVVVGGTLAGTVDFDPGIVVNYQSPNGTFDGFICKLNANGQFCWVRHFGGGATAQCFAVKFNDQ